MPSNVDPIPEGYGTVMPALCVRDAARAIEFYKKAFGALELTRMAGPDGKIMHAEIKIGGSIVFLCDEFPDMPGACRAPQTLNGVTSGLYLYVPDADSLFARALKAGAKQIMPLSDMFWGDRYGKLQDPFGHFWGLATRKENLSPQEIKKRQEDYFSAAKS